MIWLDGCWCVRASPWTDAFMTTVGVLGAGGVVETVAALSVAAGHRAVLSDSRGPGALADLVTKLGPLASAATGELAAESGDIVMVRTPLGAYGGIPVEAT